MKLFNTLSIITLTTALNLGCSGGGNTPPPSPNGIYTGSITGGVGGLTNGGEKGIIYNNRMMVFSSVNNIRQMFESQLTVSGTSLSGNIIYYPDSSLPTSSSLTLSGDFTPDTSATINFTNATGSEPADGTINLVSNATLFNRGSDLSTIAFSWQGTHGLFGNSSSFAVSSTGNITGGSAFDCTYTGTILPANTSVNVYNVTLITGSNCDNNLSETLPINTTYTGFAWTEGTNDEILNFTVSDGTNSRSIVLTKN